MKIDKHAEEVRSLRTMRNRWKLRGSQFNPLERLDGENDVVESIYQLKDSPLLFRSIDRHARDTSTERLLDDLEEIYGLAMKPWESFRTVFESAASDRLRLRWPNGTFPARIRREAFSRFWELKSTSRFSVNATPSLHALRRVNWPSPPISDRHVVGIAACVCIVNAIESLEEILANWGAESRPYRGGKSFVWLAQNDPEKLEMILGVILEEPSEMGFYRDQLARARASRNQAEAWLAHVSTLEISDAEIERSAATARAQALLEAKSKTALQNRSNAKIPRKKGTKSLTPQALAEYFMANPDKSSKANTLSLAAIHGASESTVRRRLRLAKELNLLS